MTSDDLVHSLYIPAFRLKQDVVPGRYTDLHVHATKPGEYTIYCTEYCGAGHSNMMSKAVVYPAAQFLEKLELSGGHSPSTTPADIGQWLYENKACNACHHLTDEKLIGPGFRGLWGKRRTFTDGSSTTADENYIRHSILNPRAQIVKGYPNAMPSYQGQLGDREIDALIAFLKTLK